MATRLLHSLKNSIYIYSIYMYKEDLALKKRTKQDTFPFFINLLLFVFPYICMYYISLFVFCSFVLWHSWLLFFHFPSLTILCIEYQVFHTWNSGANLCREEENLIFCFGALFNSTLNFTQSGWLILLNPNHLSGQQ